MKIAIIGYGKMGKTIDAIATERGHDVFLKINDQNLDQLTVENLAKADVAIEFTIPNAAFSNIKLCVEAGTPIVVGTTGWLDKLPEVEAMVKEKNGGFFYASNYSVGVNLFFALNKKLAKLMNGQKEYTASMEEIHHIHKLDYPSGTAITLAEGTIEGDDTLGKYDAFLEGENEDKMADKAGTVNILSKRIDEVPGTHITYYNSEVDTIEIKHTAHSRQGFALGAVLAAEFMQGKSGQFGMQDMLGL